MHTHFSERENHAREFAMVETGILRRRMERAIETLIAALDALDGDPDLESSNDNEPNLGWTGASEGRSNTSFAIYSAGGWQPVCDGELELDESDDEDTNDRESFDPDLEPSLARTESMDQSAIQGGDDDREAQWDEEEDFLHC